MNIDEIIQLLNSLSNIDRIEQMKRAGINGEKMLGINIPELRKIAKRIGKNHPLALQLWNTKIHEAKHLASMIDDPKLVTEEQMELWAENFDSWDIVDGVVGNLFDKTRFTMEKALEWKDAEEEYKKRAGFVLMLRFTIGKQKLSNEKIAEFLPYIEEGALDDRDMVKKGVNWALRQIGKKNLYLNKKAIETAENILKINTKTANWIARDALRELRNKKVQERLVKRSKK